MRCYTWVFTVSVFLTSAVLAIASPRWPGGNSQQRPRWELGDADFSSPITDTSFVKRLLGRIHEDLRQKSNQAADLRDATSRGFETVDLKQLSDNGAGLQVHGVRQTRGKCMGRFGPYMLNCKRSGPTTI
eukprot:XP_001176669.1 PREDICTED: uncharacterized protein LOC753858 [Strongylocentrotus purpuratus]